MANQQMLPIDQEFDIYFWSLNVNELVSFTGFITEFNDNPTSTWVDTDVYGRMDAIKNFTNTKRKITCNFDIVAVDEFSAARNFLNIKALQQYMYPMYKEIKGEMILSSPPLLGVYIPTIVEENAINAAIDARYVLGALTFTANPVVTAGMMNYAFGSIPEVDALQKKFEKRGIPFPGDLILFKEYKASFTLDVIHKRPLGWVKSGGKAIYRSASFASNPTQFFTGKK
jgi:hypothetical protein